MTKQRFLILEQVRPYALFFKTDDLAFDMSEMEELYQKTSQFFGRMQSIEVVESIFQPPPGKRRTAADTDRLLELDLSSDFVAVNREGRYGISASAG